MPGFARKGATWSRSWPIPASAEWHNFRKPRFLEPGRSAFTRHVFKKLSINGFTMHVFSSMGLPPTTAVLVSVLVFLGYMIFSGKRKEKMVNSFKLKISLYSRKFSTWIQLVGLRHQSRAPRRSGGQRHLNGDLKSFKRDIYIYV